MFLVPGMRLWVGGIEPFLHLAVLFLVSTQFLPSVAPLPCSSVSALPPVVGV